LLFSGSRRYSSIDMPIYSHSRLGTYEQCPLKYKYAYIDGIKLRKDHAESFLGSRFHEVMEHLYEQAPARVPTLDDLTALFNANWDKKWHAGVIIHNNERSADDYRAIGLRAIADYYKRYAPFDSGRVLGLERELIIGLDETGRHQVRCIIDRLMRRDDDVFEIHDYKTSGFLPVQADLAADRQLALYEIAVRGSWPDVAGVELVWHYVSFDIEMGSRRTPEELSELRQKIIALIDEIEAATDFPPHESSLCSWCNFQEICPLFAHRFRVAAMPLEEYAEEVGVGLCNRYAKLEAERHDLMERIKRIEAEEEKLKEIAVAKARDEGVRRLFGDSHVLTIRDDIRVRYPKKGDLARAGFESSMKMLGLWEEVLDVSWSSLKSLAERLGWVSPGAVPPELNEFVEVEKANQVRLSRRKEKGEGK